jgi:hypothetical protein
MKAAACKKVNADFGQSLTAVHARGAFFGAGIRGMPGGFII